MSVKKSNGFDISVGIDGKGASVNDILKLFVSFNGDASEELIEKEITNSQISEGIVKFKIDDKSINGEGAYTFQAKLVDVQNQK